MSRFRVTYLPGAPWKHPEIAVVETLEGVPDYSIAEFTDRIVAGSLGPEWTQGRTILAVEKLPPTWTPRRKKGLALAVVGIGVVLLVIGLYTVPPAHPILQVSHSWSFEIQAMGQCPNGCGNPEVVQHFMNGSTVSGGWSAPYPLSMLITGPNQLVCPIGGISSAPGSCSQTMTTHGSFAFTASSGSYTFVALSIEPENVSVTGTWDAPLL